MATDIFKDQKGSKDIVKIVHVTSVVQPYCYEATRILFVCNENKNKEFYDFFSSGSVSAAIHDSTTMHVCIPLLVNNKISWTTDVKWPILTISLLPFWALNVVVALRGQKALRDYLNLCSEGERRFYGFGTTGFLNISQDLSKKLIYFQNMLHDGTHTLEYHCGISVH